MSIELPDGVSLTQLGDLDAVRVETADGTGELVLQGAQVVRWTPAGQSPVLFVSDKSFFRVGKAIRGGIPLCGPWFGPSRSGDRTPAHGFYRVANWRLTAAEQTPDGIRLSLDLTAADLAGVAGSEGWPSDAALRFEVTFGQQLRVALTTRTGADGMDLEEALHTYFAVGDVRRAGVEGLDETPYVDKVDAGATKMQAGPVSFSGETDRVYASTATCAIVDPALARTIRVAKSGSGSTVVWNPWIDKAAGISDFADDEWPSMLCVETANAMGDAVVIPPDSEHTISATISVE